uniref:SGTA homodimerisation domain-containing protein n=1 Tax=Acrobeloides nanus TaxID=290746 RepID=A0A914D7T4_9BILA
MSASGENKGKLSVDEKNLVVSFIQFLREKVSKNECTDDQIEGLEVAVQCLESAFGLTDKNYAFQPSKTLLEIFKTAEGLNIDEDFPTPTQAEIEQANRLKEEGNDLVKASKFEDAILRYNQAIKLNRDPIYFCNRAAAYCRLDQYDLAIQDCRTALALDPKYAKAYGRMGLALSCQLRYDQAVEAYKLALELEPENESYKNNLAIAQEKLEEAKKTFSENPQANPFAGGLGGMLGGLGGGMPPLDQILNNPQMMQFASQMMSDPNIQNMMSNMMGSFMPRGAAGGEAPASGGSGAGGAGMPNLQDLLQAGAQMAQQMQQANPELVEQLRRQFGGMGGENPDDNTGGGPGQNPPSQ